MDNRGVSIQEGIGMEKYRKVKSKADGLDLEILEVIPEGKVKGIVQIVHGMQEHKERYLHFMEFLAAHGYACIAHDHRGHGNSVKDVEDRGYFYDEKGEAIVEDINDVIEDLKKRYPDVPVYMLGHSMGSLVVRKYLKKHDDKISRLIITGPVWNNPASGPGLALVKILSRLQGGKKVSPFVEKISNGSFDKGIPGTEKNRWLSANEENVKSFNDDPHSGFPFTLNGYQNLLQLVRDVYDPKGWQMKNPDIPVYFLGGEQDPVIGSPKEFDNTVQKLKDKGYTNVSKKLYPHMRHEILNETNRMEVYEDILKFLEGDH